MEQKVKQENLPDCATQAGIYSPFLAFALIKLLYYCNFGYSTLISPVYRMMSGIVVLPFKNVMCGVGKTKRAERSGLS